MRTAESVAEHPAGEKRRRVMRSLTATQRRQWADVIEALHASRPEAVVVLTGYGNIATA
jgi:hypothetical protein